MGSAQVEADPLRSARALDPAAAVGQALAVTAAGPLPLARHVDEHPVAAGLDVGTATERRHLADLIGDFAGGPAGHVRGGVQVDRDDPLPAGFLAGLRVRD